jgi:Na+/proline symporter
MTALPTVLSLAAISIVFSVSDLVRKIREREKDQTRSGNTMYMITSVVFILLMLVLDIIPTFFYFLKESRTVQFSEKTWVIMGAVMLLSVILNVLAITISIRKSIRIFSRLELQ